ncbi:MAG: class I SAM-dependent methyltransferase [Ignavibacteriaceae bacterium]|nr:class I SAM-dependent methyltransferase [Ignavibacteriaceae bacterium]
MHYDPVKDVFAEVIRKIPFLRVLFYKLLDLMFLRSWFVRRELRHLRKKFGSRKIDIYDAGSGYGQYTYFMAKNLQPCSIYAVDIKEKWIEDCKNFFSSSGIGDVTFGIEDLTKITHKDKYDLIVCVDVMEHIEEDRLVFRNYHNALKNGGYVLINSPSIYGGSDVHDEGEESFIGEHARDGYSIEDLTEKFNPAGLKVYRYRYTYGFWGDKAWRLGIKYPMLMLNLSKLLFIVLPFYYLVTFPFTFLMMYADYITESKTGSGINVTAYKE